MSFADTIKGVAIPEVAGRSTEPPRIWWHNGKKSTRANIPGTPGDFYTKQSEFISGLDAPWVQEERFPGEVGYSVQVLKIAPLAWRTQPFREIRNDGDKYPRKEWLAQYVREPGVKLYTEVLCFVEGYNDLVVWASDGLTGKAVSSKTGIMRTYETGLLAEAERVAGQAMPLWSFWLPIATKRLTDDKIAYEDTGFGSFVTPPALHLPPNPLDELFVGSELLEKGARIMRQQAKWATTRRLPEHVVEGEVVPALPAPRNVPVVIGDDDEI